MREAGVRTGQEDPGAWLEAARAGSTPEVASAAGVQRYGAGAITSLQRLAGNRAVVQRLQRPTIGRGSRGEAVRALQQRLGIADDGIFGSATEQAVRRLQQHKGLAVDGVVGVRTWAVLGEQGTPSRLRPAEGGGGGEREAVTTDVPRSSLQAIGGFLTVHRSARFRSLTVGHELATGVSLSVQQQATVGGAMSVGGNLRVVGTLTVAGTTSEAGAPASVRPEAAHGPAATQRSRSSAVPLQREVLTTVAGSHTVDELDNDADLEVGAAATVGSRAVVGGGLTVGGPLSVGANVTVRGNLTVGGDLAVGGRIRARQVEQAR